MSTVQPPTPPQDADSVFIAEYFSYIEKIAVCNSMKFRHELHLINMGVNDLVQECLLCALKARHTYQSGRGTTLRSWVIRCVRNFIFERRAQCRRMRYQEGRMSTIHGILRHRSPDESNKYLQMLNDLASQLSKFEYRVLLERATHVSWDVVAQRLHVPVHKVRAVRAHIREVAEEVLDIPC